MADETRRAEERRLVQQSDTLRWRTRVLCQHGVPFDPLAHERLRQDIAAHQREIAGYRRQYLSAVLLSNG